MIWLVSKQNRWYFLGLIPVKLSIQQFSCCNNLKLYDEKDSKCCSKFGVVVAKDVKCSKKLLSAFPSVNLAVSGFL